MKPTTLNKTLALLISLAMILSLLPAAPAYAAGYSITYVENAGIDPVGGMPTVTTLTKDAWTTVSTAKPTRVGWIFIGWASIPSADTPEYAPGDWIYVGGDITLYAVWSKTMPGYYKITYLNFNTGPVPDYVEISAYKWTMVSTTVPTSTTAANFKCWATYPPTQEYQPGDWILVDDNINLHAVWDDTTYDVGYDYTTETPYTVWVDPTPYGHGSEANYEFFVHTTSGKIAIWCKDAALTDPWDYDVDRIFGDTTLYAKWLPETVTVTYHYGTASPGGFYSEDVGFAKTRGTEDYGLAVDYWTPGDDPFNNGNQFEGWYEDAALTTKYIFGSPLTSNLDLYAKWTVSTTYAVVRYDYKNGYVYTEQSDLGMPAKYEFHPSGDEIAIWCKDYDCTTPWNYASELITENTTLYAKWIPNKVTVTYHHGDGDPLGGTTDKDFEFAFSRGTENYYAATELWTIGDDVYDNGCIFEGWYSDSVFTTLYTFGSPLTGDLDLYAKWDTSLFDELHWFKTKHAVILAKALGTVTWGDKADIDEALSDYETLSPATQAKLSNEKEDLDAKQAKLWLDSYGWLLDYSPANLPPVSSAVVQGTLDIYNAMSAGAKAIVDAQPRSPGFPSAGALLQAIIDAYPQGEQEAAWWMLNYGWLLAFTPTSLPVPAISAATMDGAIDQFDLVSPAGQAYIDGQVPAGPYADKARKLLVDIRDALLAKEFKEAHAAVLALTTSTVDMTDRPAIVAALAAYDALPVGAQALLAAEKQLLDDLLAACMVGYEVFVGNRRFVPDPDGEYTVRGLATVPAVDRYVTSGLGTLTFYNPTASNPNAVITGTLNNNTRYRCVAYYSETDEEITFYVTVNNNNPRLTLSSTIMVDGVETPYASNAATNKAVTIRLDFWPESIVSGERATQTDKVQWSDDQITWYDVDAAQYFDAEPNRYVLFEVGPTALDPEVLDTNTYYFKAVGLEPPTPPLESSVVNRRVNIDSVKPIWTNDDLFDDFPPAPDTAYSANKVLTFSKAVKLTYYYTDLLTGAGEQRTTPASFAASVTLSTGTYGIWWAEDSRGNRYEFSPQPTVTIDTRAPSLSSTVTATPDDPGIPPYTSGTAPRTNQPVTIRVLIDPQTASVGETVRVMWQFTSSGEWFEAVMDPSGAFAEMRVEDGITEPGRLVYNGSFRLKAVSASGRESSVRSINVNYDHEFPRWINEDPDFPAYATPFTAYAAGKTVRFSKSVIVGYQYWDVNSVVASRETTSYSANLTCNTSGTYQIEWAEDQYGNRTDFSPVIFFKVDTRAPNLSALRWQSPDRPDGPYNTQPANTPGTAANPLTCDSVTVNLASTSVFPTYFEWSMADTGPWYPTDSAGSHTLLAANAPEQTVYFRSLNANSGAPCSASQIKAFTVFFEAPGSFASGGGTEMDPFMIETAAQLAFLAERTNAADTDYNDKYYLLVNDIDLTAYSAGTGWIQIGLVNSVPFYGSFDGNGKTITGLKINDTTLNALRRVGLFGRLNGATVKDLSVVGANIISYQNAGVLAGNIINSSVVTNCSVSGKISLTSNYGGGLIGDVSASEVANCYADVEVEGQYDIGGLIGQLSGLSTINNCNAAGKVTSNSMNAGGLVGYVLGGANLADCHATGDVSGKGVGVGGLVGFANYDYLTLTTPTFTNCYATGDVTGLVRCVGGLVGFFVNGDADNCYATGNVIGANNDGGGGVGGLIGFIETYGPKSVAITNSWASGSVGGTYEVGGLLGYAVTYQTNSSVTVENCYATGDVSGIQEIGGLIGYAGAFSLSLPDCDGESVVIKNCYATGDVSGTEWYAGGLVGYLKGSNPASIENCYATGTVGSYGAVGGIVGGTEGNSVIVKDCAAFSTSATTWYAGRILGYAFNAVALSNNVAWDGMAGSFNPPYSATTKDGADIAAAAVRADGMIGGRFDSAGGWTTANGKLPGLFGNTVDMPTWLQ